MNIKVVKLQNTVITAISLCGAFLMSNSIVSAQSFKLNGVSDMVRVFEDGYKLPQMSDSVKIFGLRGEIISGQFVISAKKDLTRITVEIGDLKEKTTGRSLPVGSTGWNFVGSVPLTKNTPNQPRSALIRQAPAKFPDYLMSERQIDVKGKMWKSVWLTVNIPETAFPGIYSGKVTVRSDQEDQSLPVSITIYPLTLPAERHLKVVEWYTTNGFSRFHGIQEEYSPAWFDMLQKYAENMAAHRQNIFQVPMEAIGISSSKSGKLEFDFTRFDQIAQVFWNTGKMDYLETGELTRFGEKRWSDNEIFLRDFPVKSSFTGEMITMSGKDVIPFLLPAFESHLRQKGWLNKTHFGIKDEPSMHNALAWKKVSSYMHDYAPDLIRMDAIETTDVLDEIEIAIPKVDHFADWYDSFRKWQQQGHELWFYTVGIFQGSLFPNKTIDVPLIDCRTMHWLNYKYDATGYLHWGWNQWTENPYEDVGMHIGDGWHVYPAKDGVLNSLRWEEMRNGIQDYEYFRMLESRITGLKDSIGSRFQWINPKQRGREIASRVIQGFAERTFDPQIVNSAKLLLISELLNFSNSPQIYVQTNPPEGSLLTGGSTVEVSGWTYPGTEIVINGNKLPVSYEGLFLEQFSLSVKNNKIVIKAVNGQKSKEIVREFRVK